MPPVLLVVDDEPDNYDVIDAFLEGQGYTLHYAASGEDALSAVEVVLPDLILLDVMMPGLDGFGVAQKLKSMAKWQNVPIIMVTALSGKDDLARCLDAGADDFVSKPVSRLELQARVRSMLRIKQQYDQIQLFSALQRDTINMLAANLDHLSQSIASSLPHEMNTPLNGIIGIIEILRDDWANLDEQSLREFLDLLDDSARRLEQLTKKFLTYVELELLDPATYLPEPTSVTLYPLQAQLLTQAKAVNREADLHLSLAPGVIQIAQRHWELLLQELCSNALKFSPPGTPITIQAQPQEQQYVVVITDQGRGMSQTELGAIQPLPRFKWSQIEGVGLGLKIVLKIMALAQGQIQVNSTPPQGTIVTLILPLAQ